jgi:hypothetical protein
MEDTTHLDASFKKFKEMVRAPKENKNSQRWKFRFQDVPISKYSSPYLVVKDVGSQKVDMTIGQLVAMVPSIQKELRNGLLAPKIPKVPTPLNVITIEHECDPIIDMQCNGLM